MDGEGNPAQPESVYEQHHVFAAHFYESRHVSTGKMPVLLPGFHHSS